MLLLTANTGGKKGSSVFTYAARIIDHTKREFGPFEEEAKHPQAHANVCDYVADVNACFIRVHVCTTVSASHSIVSYKNLQRAELNFKVEEQQQLGKWRRRERVQVAEQPAAHHDRQNDGTA